MAIEYARVLDALGMEVRVFGRGEQSALAFEAAVGRPVERVDLGEALAASGPPDYAIVAVSVEQLSRTTIRLAEGGVRRLLVEKPGGIDRREIAAVAEAADRTGASIYVAYNRRFYASVEAARKILAEDGGAVSCFFEFTELSDRIATLQKPSTVKANWFLANSTHVVDTAFHLCGAPVAMTARVSGSLDWHPVARFAGCGVTERGVQFSYHADWDAPGRWSIEVMSRQRRLILKPMERLQILERGAFEAKAVDLDDQLDLRFKPGLYQQVKSVVADPVDDRLITIQEQLGNVASHYDTMLYGGSVGV